MEGRIYKGEIRLLVPFAERIIIEPSGSAYEDSLNKDQEEVSFESCIVRESINHSSGREGPVDPGSNSTDGAVLRPERSRDGEGIPGGRGIGHR
jgi:hypothetical protein